MSKTIYVVIMYMQNLMYWILHFNQLFSTIVSISIVASIISISIVVSLVSISIIVSKVVVSIIIANVSISIPKVWRRPRDANVTSGVVMMVVWSVEIGWPVKIAWSIEAVAWPVAIIWSAETV